MENVNKKLKAKVVPAFKKDAPSYFALAFVHYLVAAISFLPALFSPTLLLLSIPFVFIPSLLSFQIQVARTKAGEPLSARNALLFFSAYYSPTFFGCYRVLVALLKTILASVLFSFVSTLVFTAVVNATPALSEQWNEINALLASGNWEAFYSYLGSHQELNTAISLEGLLLTFFFATAFLFFISKMILNVYYRMRMGGKGGEANAFFLRARPRFVGEYHRLKARALWPVYLFFPLGFALGAGIAFVFNKDPNLTTFVGLCSGYLAIVFLLPLAFLMEDEWAFLFKKQLVEHSFFEAEEAIRNLENDPNGNPEEIKEIKAKVEEARRKYEEEEKKGKDE